MYSVNFVWYNVEEEVTCACIKENSGELTKGKRVTQKGIVKPDTICNCSVWGGKVVIIFYKQHFMSLKRIAQV